MTPAKLPIIGTALLAIVAPQLSRAEVVYSCLVDAGCVERSCSTGGKDSLTLSETEAGYQLTYGNLDVAMTELVPIDENGILRMIGSNLDGNFYMLTLAANGDLAMTGHFRDQGVLVATNFGHCGRDGE